MITPEVINWIKIELQNGQTINNIKTALIQRGWKENDANNAIQSATSNNNTSQTQAPPTSFRANKFLFIGLLSIALLIVLGGGGYVLMTKKVNNQPKQTQAIPTITQKSSFPTTTQSKTTIDCGIESLDMSSPPKTPLTKLECFINATKNCNLAKLTINGSLDLGGVTTSTVFYEIKGMQNGKCELYTKQGDINHIFPTEVPQDQQKQTLDLLRKSIGMDGPCLFSKTSDLTTMFTNWKNGNFSTNVTCKLAPDGTVCTSESGDFAGGECRGAYFEYRSSAGQTSP